MKFYYDKMRFTGTRAEIVDKIKKYLDGVELHCHGTFTLGEETVDGMGTAEDIKAGMIDNLNIPCKFKGKEFTKEGLRAHLNTMNNFGLVEELGTAAVKKLLIDGIMNEV